MIEDGLETALERTILPFYNGELQSGIFEGRWGLALSYVKLEASGEKGALVMCPGRAESHIRYAELVYDLKQAGFSIYVFDHRGQGFSDRILGDRRKSHVERFEDYVADLRAFVDKVVNARDHARRFILGHSMGGTVAALYAARHQSDVDGLVLTAPMFEINTHPLPRGVAWVTTRVLTALGMGDADVPVGPRRQTDEPFEGNHLTHSEARWAMNRKLISLYPQIALGGPTVRWLGEALKATRQVLKNATQITAPTLLLQAELDNRVRPGGQDAFCRRAKVCTHVLLTGAYHEILMERDEIRDKALRSILDFLNKHTPPTQGDSRAMF
jgi:lysophospholipase